MRYGIDTDKIWEYIHANRLTKQEFAKKCDISLYYLDKVLSNERRIKFGIILKIANQINSSFESLMIEVE